MAFTPYEPGLLALLQSETGPVGLDLRRRVLQVEDQARQNAATVVRTRTGALQRSIRQQIGQDERGLYGAVYCDPDIAPHAAYIEYGTHPHSIDGRPILRSAADNPDPLREPRRHVDHPGNDPFPFLRPALEAFNP